MGCFNVACSISGLSIGAWEKIMFIPLLPPKYKYNGFKNKIAKMIYKPSSMLIYSNCFFDPFCLPIEGEYNDYGSIEDVKENSNTKAIQDFLGFSAEKLVDIICDSRSINDYFGSLFKELALNKEAMSDFNISFGKTFLEKIGFVALSKKGWYDYTLKDLPYLVYISQGEEASFSIMAADGTEVEVCRPKEHRIERREFLNKFFEFTGYHPNVAAKDQKKVNMICSMSGMFVHKEVYDSMLVNNNTFGDWGRKELDFKTIFKNGISEMQELDAKAKRYGFSYDYEIKNNMFNGAFRDWPYFMDLYKETLKEGKLKKQIVHYLNFRTVMYSANKFFFPAMNGEQHGNDKASNIIANKTVEVLKNRLHTCSECRTIDHKGIEISEKSGEYVYKYWYCRECLKEM